MEVHRHYNRISFPLVDSSVRRRLPQVGSYGGLELPVDPHSRTHSLWTRAVYARGLVTLLIAAAVAARHQTLCVGDEEKPAQCD